MSASARHHIAPSWLLLAAALCASACSGAATAPGNEAGPSGLSEAQGERLPEGERLLAQPPAGWQQTGATNLPTLRRAEFVPDDETADDWTHRITFEAMIETPLPDPIEFVDLLAESRQRECGTFERLPTFSGEENGYPTSVDLLVCHHDRKTDTSEVVLMKTIQGNDAFYIITRGERGAPIPEGGKPSVEDVEVGAWALYLRSVTVCDDARAGHACPTVAAPDRSE
ncbi:MAG: hypothetical protein AB7I04_09660 [Pseudomonadales bacterium]